ncbi:MAG: trypsin-like peptidase domain-containing protein [Rivularia sp. (in: Bacteria)]|nr:trypsin-like peptidase domain-containing protein [Rivularia sp. MS3]
MKLEGKQYQKLRDALVEAFPSQPKLAEFVKFQFDKSLNTISSENNPIDKIAFDLIGASQAEGWTDKLIAGAREANPGNPSLFIIAQELNLTISLPSQLSKVGGLEKIVKKTNSFLDVNTWREKLGTIEAQVCRIEITKKNNFQSFGTGFLIAPNVVITNYHVIEPVISENATPENVILRFDYKQLEGKVINKGTEYRLDVDDWLIDKSPYTDNSLPTADELDYALLRIDAVAGEESIANNSVPDTPHRGWIKLPDSLDYQFLPETPLLIVQHPEAQPLKLAFDTDAIISVNENGTVVKYKTNTEGGSSGSPCFDINWNLVALHHSGDPNYNPAYNAGSPFTAICARLEKQGLLAKLRSGEAMW